MGGLQRWTMEDRMEHSHLSYLIGIDKNQIYH